MEVNLNDFDARIYYSQNREDLILDCFFVGLETGFYVDVGAFDPDYDSVTKLFYQRGWRGINIEPQASKYELFIKRRKRDINLNVGIADKPGELELHTYASQGLSTLSPYISGQYEQSDNPDTQEIATYTVKVATLQQIFEEHSVTTINFLKIDVEGMELEVIKGNDWSKYRPEVICIETSNVIHPWFDLIEKEGYKLVFFDGLNNYYADEASDRAAQFDYIQHIVAERGGGIKVEDYELIKKLYENYKSTHEILSNKEHHVIELVEYNEHLIKSNEAMIAELKELRVLNKQLKSVKFLLGTAKDEMLSRRKNLKQDKS